MGIRESLLNTITSVGSSDFVRIVTSAGASSKATLQNVIKSFETGLGAKSSLTDSDYIRVVGSDNNLYKQSVSNVKSVMGVDTLSSNLTSLSNALVGFKSYDGPNLTASWSDCSYEGIGANIISMVADTAYRNKWVSLRVNNSGSSVDPFGTSSFSVLLNCSSQQYGWCILNSDSPRTGFVVGKLSGGAWSWKNVWGGMDAISTSLGAFARYSNDFSSTSPGKLDDIVSLPSGTAGRFLVMFYYNGYTFTESFSMYFIQRGATKGDFYGLTTIKKGSETRTVSLSTNGTVTKGDTNNYNARCVVFRLSV